MKSQSASLEDLNAVDLYLDLLQRSLTGTLYDDEPNHDNPDPNSFGAAFVRHYMRGSAITMLPRVRLDNIRMCIENVLSDGVPGDFIETGVWRGGGCIYMRGALKVLGGGNRTVWVADSFEGLPEPDASREKEAKFFHSTIMQKSYQRLAASYEEVQSNFYAYGLMDENVRFLKGWFKDTLPNAPIERLAVMRLDGDHYDSTMDALSALYQKLSPGGYAIIDDYGEGIWDCRQAVDEFRQQQGITNSLIRVDSKCYYWRKE